MPNPAHKLTRLARMAQTRHGHITLETYELKAPKGHRRPQQLSNERRYKMKKLITGFIFAMFLASVPSAMADNSSFLSQQWKRTQNSQKKQSEHFRKLEREAAGSADALRYGGIDNPNRATQHRCSHCGRIHVAAHYCSHCGRLHE